MCRAIPEEVPVPHEEDKMRMFTIEVDNVKRKSEKMIDIPQAQNNRANKLIDTQDVQQFDWQAEYAEHAKQTDRLTHEMSNNLFDTLFAQSRRGKQFV